MCGLKWFGGGAAAGSLGRKMWRKRLNRAVWIWSFRFFVDMLTIQWLWHRGLVLCILTMSLLINKEECRLKVSSSGLSVKELQVSFVTAVISASKRNNFSSDLRGVSRKFVSSANRILNFSMIFCKGRFLWGWTLKGAPETTVVTKRGQGPRWLRGPPWDATSCVLMALGAFQLMCEPNIFNFKDEEPSAIQKYQNAEPQLLGFDDKKWCP